MSNTKYNNSNVFGDLPHSSESLFWHQMLEKGYVRVLQGDIQPQIQSGSGARGPKRPRAKAASVQVVQSIASGSLRGNQSFRG